MQLLMQNAGTILISLLLAGLLTLILIRLIRSKKKGSSTCSCGSGCAHCAMAGSCHGGHTDGTPSKSEKPHPGKVPCPKCAACPPGEDAQDAGAR